MQTLKDYLNDKQDSSIQSLVKYMNQALTELWENVFEENKVELTQMFADYGDRAYGTYIQKFMGPIGEQVNQAGYEMKSGFNLANSIESWGPPEERERCAWYVINDSTGSPLGAAVLQIYHSHVQFQLPQAPRFFMLEETERETIIDAITSGAKRLDTYASRYSDLSKDIQMQKWEYATETGLSDYLQIYHGRQALNYDHALAIWGRNGWELISIIPQNERLIAFFKRPLGSSK